jgi:hypothetical protein
MPPNSPQWATGFPTRKRFAARPFLPKRNRATGDHRLWFPVDEQAGSQHSLSEHLGQVHFVFAAAVLPALLALAAAMARTNRTPR